MNKICTSLEQSQKLIELRIDRNTADMYYNKHPLEDYYSPIPHIGNYSVIHDKIPCWSASALLEVIRNNDRYELQMYEGGYYFESGDFMTESYFNSLDACYEMVVWSLYVVQQGCNNMISSLKIIKKDWEENKL